MGKYATKARLMFNRVKKTINEKLDGECPFGISLSDGEERIYELKRMEREGSPYVEQFFEDFKDDTKYAREIIRHKLKRLGKI